MVTRFSVIFVVTVLHVSMGQQQSSTTSDGCYTKWNSSKVNCMLAFSTQVVNTESACTGLCTQNFPKCKAAQMTTGTNACDLFDTALPVASTGRRRRATTCYGYGPAVRYSADNCYYVPTGKCTSYGGITTTQPTVPSTQATTAAPTVQTTQTAPTAADTTTLATTQPTPSSSSSGPIPDGATCPSGKVARYTVVDGVQLSDQPDASFQVTDEQACLKACADNRKADGTSAPCRSADFNSKTLQCSISMQVTPPVGTATPQPNADYRHFEKVCVDEAISQQCTGPYYRAPQHILVGNAQAVVTAADTIDCLQMCASAQTRFNFVCTSGMFYFTETTNNCILNSETRTTHPDLFTPETNDGVEYFEPGCTNARARRQAAKPKPKPELKPSEKRNRNVLVLNDPNFSAWTMCDAQERSHMRFKQCASYNPNTCQPDLNGCDPAKEKEYDLEIVKSKNDSNAERMKKPKGPVAQVRSRPQANPSVCQPMIRSDGRVLCERGVRFAIRGKNQLCKPSKKECDAEQKKKHSKSGR